MSWDRKEYSLQSSTVICSDTSGNLSDFQAHKKKQQEAIDSFFTLLEVLVYNELDQKLLMNYDNSPREAGAGVGF